MELADQQHLSIQTDLREENCEQKYHVFKLIKKPVLIRTLQFEINYVKLKIKLNKSYFNRPTKLKRLECSNLKQITLT